MKDGITHDQLTEKIGVDKAATTRAIVKLEESGYVKRIQDTKDKRKYFIFLTDYAKANREDIINTSRKWEKELTEQLTQEELEQFYYLFRKVTNRPLEELFSEERI